MTQREAAIYQIKQLKGKPLKVKIAHIFTYYWVPIVAILAIVVFMISLGVHYTNQKESALMMCCINSIADENRVQEYLDSFASSSGIDKSEYEVSARLDLTINESETELGYQNAQLIAGMMATQSLDIISADKENILRYSYQDVFLDLSQLLSTEAIKKLEPYFIYVDQDFLRNMEPFSNQPPQYPDFTDPGNMKEPVPVALILPPDWEITQILSPLGETDIAIGLVANANNTGNAVQFINYILEQEGL